MSFYLTIDSEVTFTCVKPIALKIYNIDFQLFEKLI